MEQPGIIKCDNCNTDLVIITRSVLNKMKKQGMVFKSVPESIINASSKSIMICPLCDAYALGLDRDPAFTFKTQDGRQLTIHEL